MQRISLIIVNLLIFLFLLIIVELVLETYSSDNRNYSVLSRYILLREFALPNTIDKVEPDRGYVKFTENLELKPYHFKTDSLGFIESETVLDSPKLKIIFFGGSTTECLYVDDTLRFPSLVGKKLQKKGFAVNTYNSGRSGNHTIHCLNLLVNKVIHRDFDIAVLMNNINDYIFLSYYGNYYEESKTPSRQNIVTLPNPSFYDHDLSYFSKTSFWFRSKKSFQVLLPEIYNQLHDIKIKTEVNTCPEFIQGTFRSVGQLQEEQFRQNLLSFIALCRSASIEPVLMTQFNRINEYEFAHNPIFKPYTDKLNKSAVDVNEFCNGYRRFNDIIREVAALEGILLIDLANLIPQDKTYLYDMIHLNNQGSKLVSNLIVEQLENHIFHGENKSQNVNYLSPQ